MRALKSDLNQAAIVRTFRQAGATVQDLHAVGHGCPDLLVGIHGKTYLIEVKSKRGKFTPAQVEWWWNWQGQALVIRSCLQVVEFLNEISLK